MSRTTTTRTRVLALLVALAATGVTAAQTAAPEDSGGKITGEGARRIPLAVPPAEAGGGATLAQAAEIGQVLRDDLDLSGWFALLDPR